MAHHRIVCVAQMDRAPDRGSGGRRSDSAHTPHGILAQLAERQIEALRVSGSIPENPAKRPLFAGRFALKNQFPQIKLPRTKECGGPLRESILESLSGTENIRL